MPRIQFEIDEAGLEEIKAMMVQSRIKTLSNFLNEMVQLFRWAFKERHAGRVISAINESTGQSMQLVMPSLERVAPPDLALEGTWNAAMRQVMSRGDERFRAETERMRQLRILDEHGKATSSQLPPDMENSSRTDVAS